MCAVLLFLELKCVQDFFLFEWTMATSRPYPCRNIRKVKLLLRPNVFPHLDSSFFQPDKVPCCFVYLLSYNNRESAIQEYLLPVWTFNISPLSCWLTEPRHMIMLMTQRRIRHIVSSHGLLIFLVILNHICRKGTSLLFFRAKRLFTWLLHNIICPIVRLNSGIVVTDVSNEVWNQSVFTGICFLSQPFVLPVTSC
jgi:hypothetical protein